MEWLKGGGVPLNRPPPGNLFSRIRHFSREKIACCLSPGEREGKKVWPRFPGLARTSPRVDVELWQLSPIVQTITGAREALIKRNTFRWRGCPYPANRFAIIIDIPGSRIIITTFNIYAISDTIYARNYRYFSDGFPIGDPIIRFG